MGTLACRESLVGLGEEAKFGPAEGGRSLIVRRTKLDHPFKEKDPGGREDLEGDKT